MAGRTAEEQARIESCIAANQEADFSAIEAEWDQIDDGIEEPWSETTVD
jgi:hypothetical protein